MQVPILNGIYTDKVVDFRTAYPVNMMPVPSVTGISSGYLRPAEGLTRLGAGLGAPRGGINWNNKCYRVMGSSFVRINSDNTLTLLGDVGLGADLHERCTFDYSFDRLAITSGGRLYYWDGAALTQVVDADLGYAKTVKWVDGYFMTTDGTYLVVTELNDPMSVSPLKYGSSEIDPDPIETILKLRNEIYAVNRYTIEVFDNVGGELFPFQRVTGAQIQKGAIGPYAACVFADAIAFLGSSKNEGPSIYLGANASTKKISTREIDTLLLSYSTTDLASVVLETRVQQGHQHLWVHLLDRTLVYDLSASQLVNEAVWFQLTSAQLGFSLYRGIDLVWCYDDWLITDAITGDYGKLDDTTARHFGAVVRWEFNTAVLYNESKGAIIKSIELVCLTGRVEADEDPQISTSYSVDGLLWSLPQYIRVGTLGERTKRLVWFRQGYMSFWRIQRFTGDSKALIAVARLEAQLEPLV